jgi:hypothetical protein
VGWQTLFRSEGVCQSLGPNFCETLRNRSTLGQARARDWLWPATGTRINRFGPASAAKTRRQRSGAVSTSAAPWITRTRTVTRAAAATGLTASIGTYASSSAFANARLTRSAVSHRGARSVAIVRRSENVSAVTTAANRRSMAAV